MLTRVGKRPDGAVWYSPFNRTDRYVQSTPDVSPRSILVIDHNPDSAFLLVKTLARKFPQSGVQMCTDLASAVSAVRSELVEVVVLHRTQKEDPVSLIHLIREIRPTVPIIAVSSVDRSETALQAGATGFVNMEAWLTIGTVVENALKSRPAD